MNTNDNILTALAALEQNLKDIVSAKNQVAEVVQSSKDLAEVIASYKESFEGLSTNITQILDTSKDLNLNVLSELSKLTADLKDEVSILAGFDFDAKFQNLQLETIKQIEKELSGRLSIIDTKARVLQEKADQIQAQVDRYESIDLENYFDKHQKTFNDLFNFLSQQDKRLHNRLEIVENLLIELQQQGNDLRNDIMTNRVIQIVGVAVIFVSIIVFRFFLKKG